jgi:hypothetical protein
MVGDKRLVFSLSIGERPWFELFCPYMQAYAKRWKAEFLAPTGPYLDDLLCRAQKLEVIHRSLEAFDRVLYVDDTVFIRPGSPLLPADDDDGEMPPLYGSLDDKLSSIFPGWEKTMEEAFAYYEVPCQQHRVFSSGVMLLHKKHRPMFDRSPTRPLKKFGYLADQWRVNAMQQKLQIPFRDLGDRYNFHGLVLRDRGALAGQKWSLPMDEVYFFHLTRAIGRSDRRLAYAQALVTLFG